MSRGQALRQNETMRIPHRVTRCALLMTVVIVSPAWGEVRQAEDPHTGPAMKSPSAMTEERGGEAMETEGGDSGTSGHASMTMGAMDMGQMQGGSPPSDARDSDAYAEGYGFGPYRPHMADSRSLGSLLVDRLETVRGDHNSFTAYDLEGWYGRSYDRAVLKAEGDINSNEIADARSELLWGHAVAAYWDTQLGARYDSGHGPNRVWLAFGVQGLAPYWFDVDLTGYLGEEERTALRFDTEYELLLTQKLILQPRVEGNAYGKSDPKRGVGSGLSDLTAGLRLRYEIRRQFAPYLGVEWARRFGETQDLAKDAGEEGSDTRFVAGLRFWF
jgi:copper resistance protein B